MKITLFVPLPFFLVCFEFEKQQKESNENPKLLQPLMYWVLFSAAKKNNAMLYHQDLAIAKFRMVEYWNKDSDFK